MIMFLIIWAVCAIFTFYMVCYMLWHGCKKLGRWLIGLEAPPDYGYPDIGLREVMQDLDPAALYGEVLPPELPTLDVVIARTQARLALPPSGLKALPDYRWPTARYD